MTTSWCVCCSHPSFSLFKLAGKEPLGAPRAALFDIDQAKFLHAVPVNASGTNLSPDDVGRLVSEPEKIITPPVASPKVQHKHEKQAKKEKKEKKVRDSARTCAMPLLT